MLVLQFIPDAPRAVAEISRVVRPGGTITAAVWDGISSVPLRILWDIAGTLDPTVSGVPIRYLSAPGEMAAAWHEAGLIDVEQTSLVVRMEFTSFDDFWSPIAA